MSTTFASLTTGFDDIHDSGVLAPPVATPINSEIQTWTNQIYGADDGAISVGFWQASIGRSFWDFEGYSEAIVVLQGRLTVTEEGGEPHELGPGDVAIFPSGWRGEWNITEDLRKFYAVFP